MRFNRSWCVPLLYLLSLVFPTTVHAAVFGETGVSNPVMTWTGGAVRCQNNVVRYEWTISQTDSAHAQPHQPMAETGLPNVVVSFNANILTVAQSAPSQSTTTISGNQLMQNVVDDGPNVVQEFTFQGITCANFGTIIYSMSATAPATGTTTPQLSFPIRGTNGFSATPVTVGTTTAGTTAPTTAPTTATTTPTTATAGTTKPTTTVATSAPTTAGTNGNPNVVKVAGGFNGNGCFGNAGVIFQFQIQESNNGGQTFSQPMAEVGLPTITVTFSNPVTFTGTVFNVANSQVAGNSWTFTLQDDQPNVGVGLSFSGVTCNGGQFSMRPTYKISAQANGQAWAVIGTGAAGFVGGNGALTPVAMATSAPTNPMTAINKNTFGTAMVKNAVQTFALQGTDCWTQNNVAHAELLFFISQTDSSSPTTPHGPMSETGLPTVTITFGAPITVTGPFNVGASTTNGASWIFTEQNDQGVIGAGFAFGAGVTCTNGQLSNNGQQFTFAISAQANGVIMPTTSNSPGFKPAAANLLDDGSGAVVDTTATNNASGSTIPIGVIAGAIAGGVALLVIASILIIRYRRQNASPSSKPKVAWYVGRETVDNKV